MVGYFEGDILVQALHVKSSSVSASIGGRRYSGSGGFRRYLYVESEHIAWVGSKRISAQVPFGRVDATNAALTAGSGAGTVGVGASIEVSVTIKMCIYRQNAVVNAVGNGNGLFAFSGSYLRHMLSNTPPNVDNNVQPSGRHLIYPP